jgi:hypothetical protein
MLSADEMDCRFAENTARVRNCPEPFPDLPGVSQLEQIAGLILDREWTNTPTEGCSNGQNHFSLHILPMNCASFRR